MDVRKLAVVLLACCLGPTPALAQEKSAAAPPAAAQVATDFDRPAFGIRATLPAGWSIHREASNELRLIVSFGMPKVWSELEKQDIENAVYIRAYRDDWAKSVDDVAAWETQRVQDIQVSRTPADTAAGKADLVVTKIKGLEYKTWVTYRYENGVGYAIGFTATPGTFDINVGKYQDFLAKLAFAPPTAGAGK